MKPRKCPYFGCTERKAEKRDMDRHVLSSHQKWAREHGYDTEKFICKICGKDFTRKDNRKKHMDVKHKGVVNADRAS
ncbi:hypothetical protein SLS62_009536 [Diatrype stigma]|uniref:C2H2-type domain-containing protein n=1 Tax=Diatrype stigma TaxID=117547 RepID=A0AAN9YJ63_9PEZI